MVMMGDFNHINLEEVEGERKEDRKFIDMVNDTFLQPHVEETTREGSKYILDLILTTDETLVNKVKGGEIFNRSGHQIIRWTLSVGEPMMEESLHRKFNYLKADYDLVSLKMRAKDLERRTKDASVNESWNLLKKSLNEVIEETMPRAVGMVKKRPWVTRKVQKKGGRSRALRKYSKLRKENEVSKSDLADQIREMKQKYVEKRNQSNRPNREAVKDYENNLAANVKSDSKSFYKYVRSRQRKKDRVGTIPNTPRRALTKEEEVAE